MKNINRFLRERNVCQRAESKREEKRKGTFRLGEIDFVLIREEHERLYTM